MDVTTAELRIEAVQIADMALDAECVLERAQVASEAVSVSAMPYLGAVGAYNKHWHVDAVSLPHNAIRYILSTLFSATSSLHTLALDATSNDVELYGKYLFHCSRFFTALLACEEAALYEEAETALLRRVDLGGPALSLGARVTTRRALQTHLTDLRAVARDTTHAPALEISSRARAALHDFTAQAQAYFKAKERALPRVLSKRFRGSRGKTKIEGRTLEILAKQEGGLTFAAMLVSSLGSSGVVEEFASRNFARDPLKKDAFVRARESLHVGFLQIPVVFEAAARKYAGRFSVHLFLKEYGKNLARDEVVALVEQ